MPLNNRLFWGIGLGLVICACGQLEGVGEARPRKATVAKAASLPPAPFSEEAEAAGAGPQAAIPQDQVNYDEVGYASWYGPGFEGNDTAMGEAFNPEAITAAHKSLPIPSYAEVTNLDTGRTILVRVNDRGPYKPGRIVDLSLGAARQLGVEDQGTFPVRVRRTNPPEYEKNALKNGEKAAERLETPPALLNALRKRLGAVPKPEFVADRPERKPMVTRPLIKKPVSKPVPEPEDRAVDTAKSGDRFIIEEGSGRKPSPKPRPAPAPKTAADPAPAPSATGNWYIQVGAYGNEANAKAAAVRSGGGIVQAGNIYRVRTGPYASETAARAALGGLARKGYPGARVTR